MFKTIVNPKQTNSNIMFLKKLTQLELSDLFNYLTSPENKESILLNLINGFAVSVESTDFRVTMFNRTEYFILLASIRREFNK